MLDVITTHIKKQYCVKAEEAVQRTTKCHHFMCMRVV